MNSYSRSHRWPSTEGSHWRSGISRHSATKSTRERSSSPRDPAQNRGQYAQLFGGPGVVTLTAAAPPAIEDDTPVEIARPATKLANWAQRLRMLAVTVLVLATLIAAGNGAVALVNGSWSVNPVLSGSMRPGLAVGSVVISERVPVSQLAVRDVIEFQEPNNPSVQMVHRIVKIAKDPSGQFAINTQGDANSVRDPWALTIRGGVAYRVRWSIPLVGYLAVAYQNNQGVALLGAGSILLAIAATTVFKSHRRAKAFSNLEG